MQTNSIYKIQNQQAKSTQARVIGAVEKVNVAAVGAVPDRDEVQFFDGSVVFLPCMIHFQPKKRGPLRGKLCTALLLYVFKKQLLYLSTLPTLSQKSNQL